MISIQFKRKYASTPIFGIQKNVVVQKVNSSIGI